MAQLVSTATNARLRTLSSRGMLIDFLEPSDPRESFADLRSATTSIHANRRKFPSFVSIKKCFGVGFALHLVFLFSVEWSNSVFGEKFSFYFSETIEHDVSLSKSACFT